jgi:hypothetical protein
MSQYIERSFAKISIFNENGKARETPMDSTYRAEPSTGEPDQALVLIFQQALGTLNYLRKVRVDISYALFILQTLTLHPTEAGLIQLKRLLKYVYTTRFLGLTFGPPSEENNRITVFCDASLGTIHNGHSVVSFLVNFNHNILLWGAASSKLVCTSSAESEIVALYNSLKKLNYLRNYCEEINLPALNEVMIYTDNQAIIDITNRTSSGKKSRHFKLKYLRVREFLDREGGILTHIAGDNNPSDMFTKPLAKEVFIRYRSQLMSDVRFFMKDFFVAA